MSIHLETDRPSPSHFNYYSAIFSKAAVLAAEVLILSSQATYLGFKGSTLYKADSTLRAFCLFGASAGIGLACAIHIYDMVRTAALGQKEEIIEWRANMYCYTDRNAKDIGDYIVQKIALTVICSLAGVALFFCAALIGRVCKVIYEEGDKRLAAAFIRMLKIFIR